MFGLLRFLEGWPQKVVDVLAPLMFLAAGLLAASGLAKLADPRPASRALVSVGVPGGPAAARTLGAVELVVGTSCVVAPRIPAVMAQGVLYLGFAGLLAYLIARKVPVSSCGCVGRIEAPPSLLHVALDLTAAAASLAGVLVPMPGLATFVREMPMAGVPFLVGLVAAGYLAVLAVTHLPELFFSWRGSRAAASEVVGT